MKVHIVIPVSSSYWGDIARDISAVFTDLTEARKFAALKNKRSLRLNYVVKTKTVKDQHHD